MATRDGTKSRAPEGWEGRAPRTSMIYVSGNQDKTHEQQNYEIIQKVKRITASTVMITTKGSWQGTCMVTMGGIPLKECLTSHYSVTDGAPLDIKMFVSTEKSDNVLYEQDVVIAEYDRPVDLPLKFNIKVKFFPLISDLEHKYNSDYNIAREIGGIAFETDGAPFELTGKEPDLATYAIPASIHNSLKHEFFTLDTDSKWQLPEENWGDRPYSFQIHLKVEH